VFIDFEGISGSGKSALAARVAGRLTRLGYRVAHVQPSPAGGSVAARLGELSSDSRRRGLHPRAWLFLELARETQAREDAVLPALRRGEICLTEGSLLGSWATAQAGFGFPAAALSGAFNLAEARVQPELLVLLDADPELARWRRLAQSPTAAGPWSRGVQARTRQELLAMASRDPSRWLVVDNEGRSLRLIEERIVNAILTRMERRQGEAEPILPVTSPPPAARTLQALGRAFFQALDRIAVFEPKVALLLLAGIGSGEALRRRLAAMERHPHEVARSLVGLVSPEALRLRELLVGRAPREVALGLRGACGPSVDALRERLFPLAPGEVVATLGGDDRAYAWDFRERALGLGLEEEVLRGLAGVDGARAWRVRSAGLTRGWRAALAESLGDLESAEAETLRERLLPDAPLAVLGATRGLASPRAAGLREALFERAPGAVLRSLVGVETLAAFALRERAAPSCPEALESLIGLDGEAAWRLRERFATRWPAAVATSLGALARTPRGSALLERVLSQAGEELGVLRGGFAAWLRSPTLPAGARPTVPFEQRTGSAVE